MYGAYIYDTAEILLRTNGRTNKRILGVGWGGCTWMPPTSPPPLRIINNCPSPYCCVINSSRWWEVFVCTMHGVWHILVLVPGWRTSLCSTEVLLADLVFEPYRPLLGLSVPNYSMVIYLSIALGHKLKCYIHLRGSCWYVSLTMTSSSPGWKLHISCIDHPHAGVWTEGVPKGGVAPVVCSQGQLIAIPWARVRWFLTILKNPHKTQIFFCV